MAGTDRTAGSRVRTLLAAAVLVVGAWLLLLWLLFVLVFVFDPDARSSSGVVATGLLTLVVGLPGGVAVRWGARRLRLGPAGESRRARRSEYRRMVDELPDDLGWFERSSARQEIRKDLAFREGSARFSTRRRELITALAAAGHDPHVTARWVDGSEYSTGGWRFGLTCRNCHERDRGRLIRRFVGLSPGRPCAPSWTR